MWGAPEMRFLSLIRHTDPIPGKSTALVSAPKTAIIGTCAANHHCFSGWGIRLIAISTIVSSYSDIAIFFDNVVIVYL
jgi:hypothetical protein